MGFPIVTPAILNDLKEQLFPLNPDHFCDIAVTVSAVEYVPKLSNIDIAKVYISEKNTLAFNMINLPDDQSEEFVRKSNALLSTYPAAHYYWQMRSLFMNVIQDRRINLEKRFLLLNYAVKTVQGMFDNGQADRIPQFIDQFTSQEDYTPVLEFFKQVRPNPAYALADGISLIKFLKKPNAAYKEVLNTVYKNLGISGPESLKLIDMQKYIGMRKAYSEAMNTEKSIAIENILVNFIWANSLPFNNPSLTYWDHFVFFCSLYNAVKILYTCYMPGKEDEEFAKAISAFDAAVRATNDNLMYKVVMAVKNSGQSNNGDMAMLTLS
ncbi:MAG: hypothetical protein IKK42_02535 [Oscillospiraceae bacterium]|nr:hypothetical protein [Oscillospiraceae bacterium]